MRCSLFAAETGEAHHGLEAVGEPLPRLLRLLGLLLPFVLALGVLLHLLLLAQLVDARVELLERRALVKGVGGGLFSVGWLVRAEAGLDIF